MHKLVTNDDFAEAPPNLRGIKYFDLLICHNHLLTKPNICANLSEISDLSCITFSLVPPGFLMETLLSFVNFTLALLLCGKGGKLKGLGLQGDRVNISDKRGDCILQGPSIKSQHIPPPTPLTQ